MNELEKVLKEMGLGEKEQVLYGLILEHGKIAPTLLSRLTKINRTTIYSVANELKEKGLIIEDLGGKVLYYLPAPAEELERVIRKERENVKKKETVVRELQEILKSVPSSKTYAVPKIRFIEEESLERYLYEATPRWIESMLVNEPTWWGFQDHTFVKKFEKWIDWSWEKSPEEINLKLFTNESDVEKKMKDKKYAGRRHMKFLQSEKFSASQWVLGDYIVLIKTDGRPRYLTEIHDSALAHNMRQIFKGLWDKI